MSNRTIIVLAASVTIILAVIAIAVTSLHNNNPFVPIPFAFNLSTSENNVTAMQAQNLTINVSATYLQGQPEPIMLLVSGGPNGTLYQFSNQTGTPTTTQPFTSNLTIAVPPSAASDSYLIEVTSNTSTPNGHALFNLTIINAQVRVSGNVTIDSKVAVRGGVLEVIPTDILFTSNSTGETYQAKIHRFTDTALTPGKIGNYSIMLPNLQSYDVEFYCFSYPHFIPVLRTPTCVIYNEHFNVSCGLGVNSVVANFTG